MGNTVGTKGQVVIEKEIRDRLGVQPGWTALQRLVGDHIEVYFLPPKHNRSLKGVLSKYAAGVSLSEEDWQAAREAAWAEAAEDRMRGLS